MTTTPDPMTEGAEGFSPARTTEITLVTGDRYRVEGDAEEVGRRIMDAARGSIMQLAVLIEAGSRAELAVNPEHVTLLRAAGGTAEA